VAHPAYAGTLFAALRPFHDGHDVTLVIDDDATLVELLVACGAHVELRLAHYRGELAVDTVHHRAQHRVHHRAHHRSARRAHHRSVHRARHRAPH